MTPGERFCYQSCKYLEFNDPPLDSLNSIFFTRIAGKIFLYSSVHASDQLTVI